MADGQRSDVLTVLDILREERCASGTKSSGYDHRVVDSHTTQSSSLHAGLMKINCQRNGYSTQHPNIRQRLNDFPLSTKVKMRAQGTPLITRVKNFHYMLNLNTASGALHSGLELKHAAHVGGHDQLSRRAADILHLLIKNFHGELVLSNV